VKIVFMGTPEFAVPSLKALCENGYDVVGVFTQPDRPKGRGNKVIASPVKQLAVEKGIQVFQPIRIRKDGVEDLKSLAPDLCVTAAFGQILSQEILDIPRRGTINVHASLLPRHRGSAPINWAILQGDETVGVTTMMTDKGIDTGDMLLKAETPYIPGETAGELTVRMAELGADLLIETLKKLEDGTLVRIPQDHENMTYDPMLTKEMGVIDWSQSAADIVNRIHGLNPWPGCSTAVEGGRLKLLRAEVAQGAGQPGEIIVADPKQGLAIAAGEGAVRINQLQAPGGKPMNSKDYLRGHPMAVGTVLKEEISNV
jgi:methionyl-tRNA formyltransferase